ncbi:hypothetical protein [Winogradskyella tangerina]|uniref:hypothetical protein n=1 Tax=Winogradskyella tangerina TaxID=2023240 RepID=UPI00130095ED|nr:hypothetical protein [Winogradskyella tangerina]
MKQPKTKNLSMRLTESIHNQFEILANENEICISEWARWILIKYKKRYGKPLRAERLTNLTQKVKDYIDELNKNIEEVKNHSKSDSDSYLELWMIQLRFRDLQSELNKLIDDLKYETALERLKRNHAQRSDSSSKRRNMSE